MSVNDYLSHFTLWGDFDVNDVSSRLGLKPSAAYPKGETSLIGTPALISTWDLHCPPDITGSEEQIEYLLAQVWPKADALRELATRFEAWFCIVGDAGLCLKSATLQKLAHLHLSLDFTNHKGEPDLEEGTSV